MARNLHIYPKAILDGNEWLFIVKVYDRATRVTNRFEHTVAAGVFAPTPVRLLKISFDMVVDDLDTDQDVDDSLFVDDIKNGPGYETVIGNWQVLAETNYAASDGSQADYYSQWSSSETKQMRNDARKAMVTQRGWFIEPGSVHQHEGDGSNEDF